MKIVQIVFFCTIDAIDIRQEHLRKHVQEHGVNGTNFLLDAKKPQLVEYECLLRLEKKI